MHVGNGMIYIEEKYKPNLEKCELLVIGQMKNLHLILK
jgi:hypothetical protein